MGHKPTADSICYSSLFLVGLVYAILALYKSPESEYIKASVNCLCIYELYAAAACQADLVLPVSDRYPISGSDISLLGLLLPMRPHLVRPTYGTHEARCYHDVANAEVSIMYLPFPLDFDRICFDICQHASHTDYLSNVPKT